MADPLWGQQLTNMWMLDPYMFDPTQKSNSFSDYNNTKLQAQNPTYNTGAGGPTNAMGQPIQSFVDWNNNAQAQYQQQLAAYNAQPMGGTPTQGTTLNSPPGGIGSGGQVPGGTINYAGMGSAGPAVQELLSNYQAAQAKLTPQQQYVQAQNNAIRQQMLGQQDAVTAAANAGRAGGQMPGGAFNPGPSASFMPMAQGGAPAPAAAPGRGPPPTMPNNWMAALNALSQPGNPVTQGATVPQAQGFQPSGGVNQAFLGQVGGGGNRNQNFLSALAALQGRKQA